MDLECSHNNYTFGNTTFDDVQFWWWRLFWPSPMSLWWHFSVVTKIRNGEIQWMLPYISINSHDNENSITLNHYSYEIVMATIHHYNHYSWWTLNVSTTPILLVMQPLVKFNLLVIEAKVHHHFSYELVMVTIHNYK